MGCSCSFVHLWEMLEWRVCTLGGGGGVVAFAIGVATVVAAIVASSTITALAIPSSAIATVTTIAITTVTAVSAGIGTAALLLAGVGYALNGIGVFECHIAELLAAGESLPTGDVLIFVRTHNLFLRLGGQNTTAQVVHVLARRHYIVAAIQSIHNIHIQLVTMVLAHYLYHLVGGKRFAILTRTLDLVHYIVVPRLTGLDVRILGIHTEVLQRSGLPLTCLLQV